MVIFATPITIVMSFGLRNFSQDARGKLSDTEASKTVTPIEIDNCRHMGHCKHRIPQNLNYTSNI